ncbi:MAG: alpha/beta hydrolase-fold protein, partial [Gemmatimonadota bacterium]
MARLVWADQAGTSLNLSSAAEADDMGALKLDLERTLGCFALLLLLATPAGAQEAGRPLTWAAEHTISSQVLNEDRPVLLALPEGYDPEAAYPVIYVLDAQWHFLHTVASTQFLAADAGRMPKAIVVGLPVQDPADRQSEFVPPVAGGRA